MHKPLIKSRECIWNIHVDVKAANLSKLKNREVIALFLLGVLSVDRVCQLLQISHGQLEGMIEQLQEIFDEYQS